MRAMTYARIATHAGVVLLLAVFVYALAGPVAINYAHGAKTWPYRLNKHETPSVIDPETWDALVTVSRGLVIRLGNQP